MAKIRVLVVDDAVVMRRLVCEVLSRDPRLEVAGWATNGKIALARIPQINPDCVTLDVEMPEMDGIQTLIEIRKKYPTLPVIMFSTVTERGAAKTVEALSRGATDYVTKPSNVGSVSESIAKLELELIPKIQAACGQCSAEKSIPPVVARLPGSVKRTTSRISAVCIAASTGGPNALQTVLTALPARLPVPVFIVQHMPPVFTALLAARLNEVAPPPICEATAGQRAELGRIYIAPGGFHMEVSLDARGPFIRLTEGEPENSCRPAADVMFRTAAAAYKGEILGVVLTGMGRDGLRGSRAILDAGGRILAQDEASSVVWGMPGYVAQEGLAEAVVGLKDVAAAILSRLRIRAPGEIA